MNVRPLGLDLLLFACNRVVGRLPSHRLRRVFYRTVMGFGLGRGSHIFMDAWFYSRRGFIVGSCSVVNEKCRLDNRGGITIGDNVAISAEVCILTTDHDVQDPQMKSRSRPVRIEDYAFIGTRAMVLPGVRIGRGSVIAAGAVVTSDVAENTVVAGVPARKIAERNPDFDYTAGYRRLLQ